MCGGVFASDTVRDMREVDIVLLAVVATRRGVNHAYFASICCDRIMCFFFPHYTVKLVLAFTVSAPVSWKPSPVQLVYLADHRMRFHQKAVWKDSGSSFFKRVPVLFCS